MHKRIDFSSTRNNYNSTILKACGVFATTVSSYGLYSSLSSLLSLIKIVAAQSNNLTEFRVNNQTTDDQSFAALTGLTNGNFVVVWESNLQDGSSYGIYGKRYAGNGTTISTEFRVNTWTQDRQEYPAIASLTNSNFAVVWQSYEQDLAYSYDSEIYGQYYAGNGSTLGGEIRVSPLGVAIHTYPSVTGLINGDVVIAWNTPLTASGDIFARRYASNGTLLNTEFRVNNWTTDTQAYPALSNLISGGFVVVWQSNNQDGSGYGVYGQRYTNNATVLGNEFRINTFTTNDQNSSSISSLSDGGFVVVWSSALQDGSSGGIYGQRYAANGLTQGTEFRVNTWTIGDQSHPSVTGLNNDGFLVVWHSPQDGSNYGIYAQLYNGDGNPLKSEFRVNTYTLNAQINPATTGLINGGFVVVWQSLNQDSSAYGVYGQVCVTPNITKNILVIPEGGTITINASSINATAHSDFWPFLIYNVSNVQYGYFGLINSTIPLNNFTQLEINNGMIQFTHDGSENPPTCTLALKASILTDGPYNTNIFFTSVNDPPILQVNRLILSEGDSVIFSQTNLFAYDSDNNDSQLIFVITNIQHGQFEALMFPGIVISNFTQAQVLASTIRFVHDGSEFAPSYSVTITDGNLFDGPHNATIIFATKNDAPTIVNNRFTIGKGDSLIITTNNLSAIDPDNNISLLEFVFSNLQHLQFELVSAPNFPISSFIQVNITNGNIRIVHDGSDFRPTGIVWVTDGLTSSNQVALQISYLAGNGTDTLTSSEIKDLTAAIAGGTVGGAVLLAGSIGVGFWYRKRSRDAETRKHHPFANYIRETLQLKGFDNFMSDKGQRYVAAIKKLETEFSTQGGMNLNQMSDDELKGLAKQVAISAKNKITPTTHLGYSIIRLEDINDQKISEIVQDVLRLRVGQDDTNIPMRTLM